MCSTLENWDWKKSSLSGRTAECSEAAGPGLAGLRVKQARNAMIERLQKDGVVFKMEEILHRTPICERSKTEIEIIPMDEYLLESSRYQGKIRANREKRIALPS